jgi:uncharacterized protein
MSFEHTAVIERPRREVFAWHARPGAIQRLTPPWQPLRVAREAGSLRDGTAVLALPGGVTWTARHLPEYYEEDARFCDELVTPVLSSVVPWRHTHVFSDEGSQRTRVTDRVDTRVPGRFLAELFAYRTRQLAGDLAVHETFGDERLTVAVTGASGLVGRALTAFLSTGGHRVIRLVRGTPAGSDRLWRPEDPDLDMLKGVDAVVHLAGASIAGRFSASHKRDVRESRVEPTRRLARAVAQAGVRTFVSASAIGVYGADRGDDELTEEAERGAGFLADLVADWEAAAHEARAEGVRVVMVRTGIVQSPAGGALRLQRLLFETGLGGRLGDGRQWQPWIGIDDLVDVYRRALTDARLEGPVNAVAPHPVRNEEYARTLARVLRRPALLPVPSFGPVLLLGREGAAEIAAASQRVLPARLEGLGHRFRFLDLEPALRHVLGRGRGST